MAEVDVVAGEAGVRVRADGYGCWGGVRGLKMVVMMMMVVMVVVEHLGQRAILRFLEGLVVQEEGQSVTVLDTPLLGAAVAGRHLGLHLLLFDCFQGESQRGATVERVFETLLASSCGALPLWIQSLAFTQTTALLDGRSQRGMILCTLFSVL